MASPYLVPSLKALFNELNTVWPQRDKKTDGWIGDSKHCPGSSDHCADSSGRVHAIDIDKDGIDPSLVINRLTQFPSVINYINHNYYQYHRSRGYEAKKLTGDPHVGWLHVSIVKSDTARAYTGGYGIVPGSMDLPAPIPDFTTTPTADWDHTTLVYSFGNEVLDVGAQLDGFASLIRSLRI